MKMMKKFATLLLAICLVVPCFSMVSFAANGAIQFTDPSTKVGETLEVIGKVKRTDNTGFGKVSVTMTYDTSYLKFKSGNGLVESQAGEITYTGDATSDVGAIHEFKLLFDVLKAGTTKLTIKEATVKSVSGAVLDYTKGSSTITIAEGEGTTVTDPVVDTPSDATGATVDVDGKTYTISSTIPTNEIPEGYVASTLEYDLVKYNVVYSENFGLYLAYMVDSDNVGSFFMYVEEDATFAPYEEISISDDVRIALLSDVSEIELPSEYVSQDVMSSKGYEFPAWKNEENPDFIVLYAINNNGEKSLYQLDNAEGTYQRFNAPEVVHEELNNTFIGKLSDLLENHLDYVILGTGIGFILFVIIIVILSVKLYNRNAELDEIYDEYGLDDDDESDEDYEEIDYEDDYDDDDEEDGDKEMEMLVQAGMKEVFPEDDEEEDDVPQEVAEKVTEKAEATVAEETIKVVIPAPAQEVTTNTVEIPIEKVVEKIAEKEDTLGAALAKQKEAANEDKEVFLDDDDDDDILDNFSMNFIDLDD
ncbi:MAG: cohesin domain-containing protein [Faecalimonas sp.]|nr:cohesin domain-containing protein [Faecalimonas sp.]